MLYYGSKISENIRRREPEGYLICVNVPIARSGTQKYLPEELDQEREGMITVYRPEEEVFSQATMASFEGMPVTNDHPESDEGVTKDNAQWLIKGHAQNVRRGTGSESNMLLADLLITDGATIEAVLNGKREISCGYNYELCEEDGRFVQRQIRGNHIAIVDKGRAGHRVCIKDSAPNNERRHNNMSKKKNGIWAKMLTSFAKDADAEELAEAVEAMDELINPEEEPKATDADVSEKLDTITDLLQNNLAPKTEEDEEEKEEVQTDDEPDKLDTVIDLLKQLLEKQVKDEEPEKDPLQKLEDDLDELEAAQETEEDEDEEDPEDLITPDEDPEEPESHFVDPEEINEEDEDETEEEEEKPVADKRAKDAMRAAIKAVKPVIAQLPPSQRKAAADAAAASLRKSYGMTGKAKRNDYLAIKKRKARSMDSAAATKKAEANLAKKIMASRNANYKK